jgi:hypothetical protein
MICYLLKVIHGNSVFEIQIGKTGYYWRIYKLTSDDGYIYYDDDDYEFFDDEILTISKFGRCITKIKKLIGK